MKALAREHSLARQVLKLAFFEGAEKMIKGIFSWTLKIVAGVTGAAVIGLGVFEEGSRRSEDAIRTLRASLSQLGALSGSLLQSKAPILLQVGAFLLDK